MSENTDAQEAEKSLVKELGSKEPNIGQIVEILSAHTELQTKLIEPSTNGTALHVAARDDSKQDRTCVTKALLEIFDMDPNIGTATWPLFWAANFVDEKGNRIQAAEAIIKHPKFDWEKTYSGRGTCLNVITNEYKTRGGGKIRQLVERRAHLGKLSTRRIPLCSVRYSLKSMFR